MTTTNERTAMAGQTNWAVLNDFSYTPVELERETTATVFYRQWNRDHTEWVERRSQSALPWRGTEDEARRLSHQLKSAEGEKRRRVNAANQWFRDRVKELTA